MSTPYIQPVYFDSKAKKLLEDLSHEDSTKRVEAYASIQSAPYEKADLPLLHEAFLKIYPEPFEAAGSTAVNESLGEKIALLGDASSIEFFEKQYPLLSGEKEPFKAIVLTTLARMQTQQSYSALTRLMASPPGNMPDYNFVSSLTDSLALAVQFYTAWQPMAKEFVFAPVIAHLSRQLVDSGYIKAADVKAAEPAFLMGAARWIEILKQSDSLQWRVYPLVSTLASFNTPASNKLLQQFLQAKSNEYRHELIMLLVKNNQPVPAFALDSVAADPDQRSAFYDALKKIKKLKYFPAKYKTQSYIAESDMRIFATDEDTRPDSIQFIKVKQAAYKGKLYNFFLYNIHFAGDGKAYNYLGITGGYDKKGKRPDQVLFIGGVYYEEEFDEDRVDEMLESFIYKNTEEEE